MRQEEFLHLWFWTQGAAICWNHFIQLGFEVRQWEFNSFLKPLKQDVFQYFLGDSVVEEIPNNHLGCICKFGDKLSINWCRISSINSSCGLHEIHLYKQYCCFITPSASRCRLASPQNYYTLWIGVCQPSMQPISMENRWLSPLSRGKSTASYSWKQRCWYLDLLQHQSPNYLYICI